jgi:DNA-binding NarL/FixJ family response regulator
MVPPTTGSGLQLIRCSAQRTANKDMKRITVLLADDHAIVRAGLRALLEAADDIHVVGEAEDGHQAVLEAARLQPDVVLLDLAMPVLNGVEAARQIAQTLPAVRVLVLSSYSNGQHVRQAIQAGVAGYVMKEAGGDGLLEAIRTTVNGDAFFSPPVLKQLMEQPKTIPADRSRGTCEVSTLPPRQAEVLQLIAEGNSTKQIAAHLRLSRKTVEKHRQNLMNRLNLHKRVALTRYAVAKGVIDLGRFSDWAPPLPSREQYQSPHEPVECVPRDPSPNL